MSICHFKYGFDNTSSTIKMSLGLVVLKLLNKYKIRVTKKQQLVLGNELGSSVTIQNPA